MTEPGKLLLDQRVVKNRENVIKFFKKLSRKIQILTLNIRYKIQCSYMNNRLKFYRCYRYTKKSELRDFIY